MGVTVSIEDFVSSVSPCESKKNGFSFSGGTSVGTLGLKKFTNTEKETYKQNNIHISGKNIEDREGMLQTLKPES